MLIVTESRLSRHHFSASAPLADANVVQRQPQQSNNRGRGGSRGRGRYNNSRGEVASSYNRSDTYTSSTVVCQVCRKPGHSACKCYHRFDLIYQDPPRFQSKQALVAANNGGWENDWHAGTGATHHITHDMANLNLKSDDYDGTDQLQVGNGQGADEEAPVRPANFASQSVIIVVNTSLPSSIPEDTTQQASDPTVTQNSTKMHAIVTRSRSNIFKPKATYDDFVRYPLLKALLSFLDSVDVEPSCYSDAIKSPHWRATMNTEFDALLRNGT
ncbi:hypothetical protein F0562_015670 [Nyssa sinensis]|uniref:Reverse transcriptase Ty1/copia-type domain-containing protein n=1 Tax=Nyssa sinensis TaxID=561372 RepID=A0A5J4ZKR8_9ASTE|nr:hypothetical protein F0562_015670 [Nyssa sinensis]